jgi:ABC-type amino acid transport substrate-binding protein
MERILRTNTIRCGYYIYPPVTYRDPNTGALSGSSVDMMNKIAADAGMKVEWTEEVNFANWVAAIQADRFDVACTPQWPDIPLSRVVAFTKPFMFAGLSPIVRAEDERFKDDLSRLNAPDVKFIAQDGNSLSAITKAAFPKAQITMLSATMDGPSLIQEIVSKKADAMLGDYNNIITYNKNNPVQLRRVAADHPVKVQAFTLAVERHQSDLKEFLDNAIQDMLNDGTIDRMLDQWEQEPGLFLRVSKPYEVSK